VAGQAVPAAELARRLLPVAHHGLIQAGVAAGEAERLLEVMAARVGAAQTGAAGTAHGRRRRRSWPATWSWPTPDGQSIAGHRRLQ
jgi:hypothetical protein